MSSSHAAVAGRRGTLSTRTLLTWIALIMFLGLVAARIDLDSLAAKLGLGDFIAYWSAGRVLSEGGNPYDWQALLAVQQPLGWTESFPNMMYYPPWALPFVLPFGLMPFATARIVWLLVQLGCVLASADLLWRYFGGPAEARRWPWALALTFVPTLIVLRVGQIGPLLLLGIAGFLMLQRRGHDGLAGALLLLPAIKPQLVYLFGIAVVLWAVDQRRWRILLGGVVAALSGVGVALCLDPHLLTNYRYALDHPPTDNITPTFGAMLRLVLGHDLTLLQYIPTILGISWLAWYWPRWRRNWNWGQHAAILLMASFLTTAYGAWVFDVVILLVGIVQIGAWAYVRADSRFTAIAAAVFVAINLVALVMNVTEASYPAFIWMTPSILVAYLYLRRLRPQPTLA